MRYGRYPEFATRPVLSLTYSLARDREPKSPNLAHQTQIDIQPDLANNGPGQKLLARGRGRGASRPGPFSLLPSQILRAAARARGGSVGLCRLNATSKSIDLS